MSDGKELLIVHWGDGTTLVVPVPNLDQIPGDSVICPTPCYPVGENEQEWLKNAEETQKP